MRFKGVFAIVIGALVITAAGLPVIAESATSADQQYLNRKIIARWHITQKDQIEAARARDIDILEERPDYRQGYFTILVSQAELDGLLQDGYKVDVLNHDWFASYAAGVQVPNGGFRTYDQAVALMDSIHLAHPTITTAKFFIGFGEEDGNWIWAMKISDNPDVDEDEEEVLFTGMHHAREPIGMEVLLETMKRLTDGYGTDTLITRLVNEREIFFVPIVNPDGYEYNRITNPDGGGMWRKNRRINFDGTRGVDLNRNYGYQWGYDNTGSSPTPGDATYRGQSAFSEQETASIRDFVNSRNFVFTMNYHSYSNLYLWPWGYDQIYTPDEAFFAAVGDSLSAYNGYTPIIGWGLYPTNGEADDWMYAGTGHTSIYSFTPEVGSGNDGFWPDPARIPTLIEENQLPNLVIIDLAENPDRIFPPEIPTWLTPDTVNSGDFEIRWTDPGGGLNAAVSYSVEELTGPYDKTDDAESGAVDWIAGGIVQSGTRAASGSFSYYGGFQSGSIHRLTAREARLVNPGDVLSMKIWYAIESDWDYAYAEVSADGGATFQTLPGNLTTNTNPNGNNRGNGITGSSGGAFVTATFDLASYVGQEIIVRLAYETDAAVLEEGIYFDDIGPLLAYTSETVLETATPDTFRAITGKVSGDFFYRVQATDTHGQTSLPGTLHKTTVFAPLAGDLDNNQVIDAIDVAWLIDHVFAGGPPGVVSGTEECNGTAGVNVTDIVYLIDFVFRGGPPPVGLP